MPKKTKISADFPSASIPEIIFDEEPELVNLYNRAWELAWEHVAKFPGAPVSPFMDEAFSPKSIWIWDTCFMALFCKYAPDVFPGVESLENFYVPLHDGVKTPLHIHHLDNPPLFAWVEWEHYLFTGNLARLERIYRAGYLQKHYALMESLPLQEPISFINKETAFRRVPLGYHWAGCPSGMDNTPRGGGGCGPDPDDQSYGYPGILWVDALAQQALSAKCLAEIAGVFNDHEEHMAWNERHKQAAQLLNNYYWDPVDEIFYDIRADAPHQHYKVKTPAAYWPLLAGCCDHHQAAGLASHLRDPKGMGGKVPFPSVSRDDFTFDPRGGYWRGGVWLPTAYMAIKALERNGFRDLASESAESLVRHMLATWLNYSPATIWEAYSPTDAAPSTRKRADLLARPDFCGWSALGPISLLIENVIGISCRGAGHLEVDWKLRKTGRHGVRNLRFGNATASLVFDGKETIDIQTNSPFNLVLNDGRFEVPAGSSSFPA